MSGATGQADIIQGLDRPFALRAQGDERVPVKHRQFDILERRGPRQEVEVLKYEAELAVPQRGELSPAQLCDANPVEEIHNTEKIRAVVLRGKLLDRSFLDEVLTKEEEFAKAH